MDLKCLPSVQYTLSGNSGLADQHQVKQENAILTDPDEACDQPSTRLRRAERNVKERSVHRIKAVGALKM